MEPVLLILMFVCLIAAIAIGIPVMFALLAVSFVFSALSIFLGLVDPAFFGAAPIRLLGIMDNQILFSIPLFVLMGKLLEHSGLAERTLKSFSFLANRPSKASISMSVIALGVLIACSSGIVGATITMLATVALPAMTHEGIRERLSAGLIISSGTLGQILPPSIVLILLSDQISSAHISAQRALGNFAPEPVSIGHLFAGALLPGLVLAIVYACYCLVMLRREPKTPLQVNENDNPSNVDWMGLICVITLLTIPASILLGIATPTEAAGIGVLILFGLSQITRRADRIQRVLQETLELIGVIFGIIIAASIFSLVVRALEGDELVAQVFQTLPENSYLGIILVMLTVFLLGFILEFIEIIYVVVPLTAPPLFMLGVDPIWFAVLLSINLQISFMTPPMGVSLFYYKSVAAIHSLDLYRAVVPFIILQLLVLLFVALYSPLATWLPAILV